MTETALLAVFLAAVAGLLAGRAWSASRNDPARPLRGFRSSPHYTEGLHCLAAGQLDNAIREFGKVLRDHPDALEVQQVLVAPVRRGRQGGARDRDAPRAARAQRPHAARSEPTRWRASAPTTAGRASSTAPAQAYTDALDVDPKNMHALAGQPETVRGAAASGGRPTRRRRGWPGCASRTKASCSGSCRRRSARRRCAPATAGRPRAPSRPRSRWTAGCSPPTSPSRSCGWRDDPRRAAAILEGAIAAVPERAYLAFATDRERLRGGRRAVPLRQPLRTALGRGRPRLACPAGARPPPPRAGAGSRGARAAAAGARGEPAGAARTPRGVAHAARDRPSAAEEQQYVATVEGRRSTSTPTSARPAAIAPTTCSGAVPTATSGTRWWRSASARRPAGAELSRRAGGDLERVRPRRLPGPSPDARPTRAAANAGSAPAAAARRHARRQRPPQQPPQTTPCSTRAAGSASPQRMASAAQPCEPLRQGSRVLTREPPPMPPRGERRRGDRLAVIVRQPGHGRRSEAQPFRGRGVRAAPTARAATARASGQGAGFPGPRLANQGPPRRRRQPSGERCQLEARHTRARRASRDGRASPRGPRARAACNASGRGVAGDPAPGRGRASSRSSSASRPAARLGRGGSPDVSTSKCAKCRFSAIGICAATRARAAASSSPSRARSRAELLPGVAVHDDQPVETQVGARLDQQRGVGHDHAAASRRELAAQADSSSRSAGGRSR